MDALVCFRLGVLVRLFCVFVICLFVSARVFVLLAVTSNMRGYIYIIYIKKKNTKPTNYTVYIFIYIKQTRIKLLWDKPVILGNKKMLDLNQPRQDRV